MMPGYMLLKAVENEIADYKSKTGNYPQMIFLENHGVFVASDTTEGIKRIYEDIVSEISAKIIMMPNMSPIEYEIKAVNEIKSLLLKNGCYISEFLTNVSGGIC